MTSSRPRVLALDLEGTLISNALSIFPRPGLRDFLEDCRASAPAIVLFTAVSASRVRTIQQLLVEEGAAPDWFAFVPQVAWSGPVKHLSFIPDVAPHEALLVDDQAAYIAPDERHLWIAIDEFAPPYPDDDSELARVAAIIRARFAG